MCGGMYLREEISLLGEGIGVIPTPDLSMSAESAAGSESTKGTGGDDSNPDLAPSTAKQPAAVSSQGGPATDSPLAQLAAIAEQVGLSFDAYQRWAVDSNNDPDATSRATWSEIPPFLASRFLRARGGFVKGLKSFEKGGGK